jgi:hypothetical protein
VSGTRQVKVEILSQAQTGGFTATDSAAEHTEGVLGRITGGIGKVGSAFGGLAKMAGGFVLAQGILSAPGKLMAMAQSAADDAASVGRLQVAVQNTGVSWDDYKGQLDGVVAGGQKLGFSDDETRDGLVTLANETGNTDEAMRRMSSAYDLARGTGMDLHTASKLLGKVTDENRNVFKKYGIDIGDAATAQDVLNVVDQKFKGQAGKYAESDAGKVARLKDAWGELQEQLGYKMLPVLSAVTSFMLDKVLPGASALADELDGPLQAGFDAIASVGERVAGGFRTIRTAIGGFVAYLQGDAIGGMNKMQSALNSIFGGETATSIVAWVTTITDAVTGFIAYIRGDALGGMNQMQTALNAVFGGETATAIVAWSTLLVDKVKGALDAVRDNFDMVRRVIGDLLTVARGPLGNAIQGMIQGFGQDGLAGILPGAIEGLEHFGDALRDLGSLALDALGMVDWAGLGETILSGIGGALSAVSSLATSIDWGAIGSALMTALGDALSTAGDVASKIGSALSTAFASIPWGDLASTAASALGTAWGALTDAGTYVYNWISGSLGAIAWGDIPGQIASGIGTAWGALTDAGTYVYTWITTGLAAIPWADIASAVSTGVGTAWSLLTDAGTWVYTWINTGLASVDWPGLAAQITAGLSGALSAAQGAAGDTSGGGFLAGIVGDVSGIIDQIQPFVDFMRDNLLTTFQNVKTAWSEFSDALTSGTDWSAVTEALSTLGTVLGGAVLVALSGITLALKLASDAAVAFAPIIGSVLAGSFTSLAGIINTVAAVITGLVKVVVDLIHGDWSAAWSDAQTMVSGAVDGIKQIFGGLPAVLAGYAADIATGIVSGLANLASDAGQKFLDLAQSGSDALAGLVTDAGTKAGEILSAIVSGLASLASDAGQSFVDFEHDALVTLGNLVIEVGTKGADIITGLVAPLIDGYHQAVDAVSTIKDGVVGVFDNALTWLSSAGADIVQGLYDGVKGAISSLNPVGLIQDLGGKITGALDIFHKSPWPAFITAGQEIVEGLVVGIQQTGPQAIAAVQSLGSLLADQANSIINANHDTFAISGSDIAQAMIDGITAKATSIGSAVAQVSDSVALALDKMQQDLIGKIDLARLSGASPEDIAKLQGQLNAVSQVLAGWAAGLGVTVTEAIDQINVSDQLVQQWQTALGNLNNVISGKAKDDLLVSITDLNNELAVAVAASAPQAVIDGLNASLATAQAQLEVVGAEYAAAVTAGIAGGISPADVTNAISTASGITDGSLVAGLRAQWDKINQAIAVGNAEGWSHDIIAAMQAQAMDIQQKLSDAMAKTSAAAAAGLLDPKALAAWNDATGKITQIPLDKLKELLPKLKDFGVSMLDTLANGIATGATSLQGALDLISGMVSASLGDLDKTNDLHISDMIAKLKELEQNLEDNLKQALLDGTDPSGIQANIDAIDALLLKLSSQAKTTAADIKAIADAALAANNAANGIGGAGSGAAAGGGLGLPGTIDQLYGGQFVGGKTAPSYLGTTAPLAVNGGGSTTINIQLTGDQEQTTLSWLFDRFGNLLDAGAALRPSTVGNGL